MVDSYLLHRQKNRHIKKVYKRRCKRGGKKLIMKIFYILNAYQMTYVGYSGHSYGLMAVQSMNEYLGKRNASVT